MHLPTSQAPKISWVTLGSWTCLGWEHVPLFLCSEDRHLLRVGTHLFWKGWLGTLPFYFYLFIFSGGFGFFYSFDLKKKKEEEKGT